MNQKELKELIEFLIEKDISEFELERGDVKVRIKRAGEQAVVHAHPDPRFFAVAPAPGPALEIGAVPVPGTVAPSAPVRRGSCPRGRTADRQVADRGNVSMRRLPLVLRHS